MNSAPCKHRVETPEEGRERETEKVKWSVESARSRRNAQDRFLAVARPTNRWSTYLNASTSLWAINLKILINRLGLPLAGRYAGWKIAQGTWPRMSNAVSPNRMRHTFSPRRAAMKTLQTISCCFLSPHEPYGRVNYAKKKQTVQAPSSRVQFSAPIHCRIAATIKSVSALHSPSTADSLMRITSSDSRCYWR